MRAVCPRLLLLLLLGLMAGVGCTGGTGPAANKPGPEGGSSEDPAGSDLHKTYAVADLPEAGEKIPPADQGRIVITLPAGWKTLQRNPKFLVAMIPEENAANSLPRIAVSVADAPAGLSASTTEENAAEQAKTLQAAADKEKEKKPYVEPCKPLGIGEHVWIRHVRQAKLAGAPVAVQSLQMVKDGRLYSVDLTVPATENTKSSKPPILYAKALKEHRDFAYAVAAHVKFPKEGTAAPETPPKTDFTPPAEGDQPKPDAPKPEPDKSE